MYLARAPEGKPVAKVGNVSAGHTPLVAAAAAYAPVWLLRRRSSVGKGGTSLPGGLAGPARTFRAWTT